MYFSNSALNLFVDDHEMDLKDIPVFKPPASSGHATSNTSTVDLQKKKSYISLRTCPVHLTLVTLLLPKPGIKETGWKSTVVHCALS